MCKKRNFKLSSKKLSTKSLTIIDNNLQLNKKIYSDKNLIFKINSQENFKTNLSNDLFLVKNEKIINKVFEGIKYGVILNKKLKQYILLNFDMDFRVYDTFQKKIIRQYNILFDIINIQINENQEFSFIQKTEEFINVVEVNENFLIICSYNFFCDYDEVGRKAKDLIKYMKKNENKHFILFK